MAEIEHRQPARPQKSKVADRPSCRPLSLQRVGVGARVWSRVGFPGPTWKVEKSSLATVDTRSPSPR